MNTFIKLMLVAAVAFAAPAVGATQSVPDSLITSKTKLSLWTTAGVKSTTVHVDTTDGVVSLYGKVPSHAQRALAETTTLGVSGVKSVKNLLQVVPAAEEKATARSDQEVKQLVEKQLAAQAALKDSQIAVKSVDKGVVLLSGQAHSYGDYLRALAATYRVDGVKRIVTEVQTPRDFLEDERITFLNNTWKFVDAKARKMEAGTSDLGITTEVKMRLLTSPQVPSTEISVDTDDGVVTLFGLVPTFDIKGAAGVEAAKAVGVRYVNNQLEVVPTIVKKTVDAKDTDIAKGVALAFKDRTELQGVTIAVKNGVVLLTGFVPSGWDQLAALRLARQVTGVRRVEHQLNLDEGAWSPLY